MVLFLTEQFLDENQVVVKQPEMLFREFPVEVNGATFFLKAISK